MENNTLGFEKLKKQYRYLLKYFNPLRNSFNNERQIFCVLIAETERFELSIQLPIYTLSRRAPSATRTRLHLKAAKIHFQNLCAEYFFCIFGGSIFYFINTYSFYQSNFFNYIFQISALISFATHRHRRKIRGIGF